MRVPAVALGNHYHVPGLPSLAAMALGKYLLRYAVAFLSVLSIVYTTADGSAPSVFHVPRMSVIRKNLYYILEQYKQ